ncbi:hypothetical protein ACFOY4_01570 [Actinomadura syzygii]|uniref:Uncharacterized protein n=1 Tax=Actinomadura syzygii TaxID=1427538 RepID=A0A5D0TTC8_9ACTN|nr:hypothetical protein [Actinomadura syzygii]TYC08565.1 hypothetical protein FXF65_37355 [Actinomadura syzygii]
MRDFAPNPGARKRHRSPEPPAQPSQPTYTFTESNNDNGDEDPMVATLQSSIAANLAPLGITSISFAEDDEMIDARARIRNKEAGYKHISDGSHDRSLCGWTIAAAPRTSAPICPVCELLDC